MRLQPWNCAAADGIPWRLSWPLPASHALVEQIAARLTTFRLLTGEPTVFCQQRSRL
jgi:hypothetical protein